MSSMRLKLIAFVFASLLILPTIDQVLNLSGRFASTENRQRAGFPHLQFPHVRNFVIRFDRYYKENFGWRNALFYAYSRWKLNLLNTSPLPEKVVVGKNGWYYLGNSYNHVIDQHRGLMPLSVDSARIIAHQLVAAQQKLAQQGIQFYVMIAPDSHTIYPENLPDHLRPSPLPSRLDVLKQAMAKTNVPFIDIRDTLRAAKRNHVLYYQTDTHWNDYGMLIGCAALLNRIRLDYPQVAPVRLADYQIEQQRGVGGDLTTMLMVQDDHKDPVFYAIQPAASLAVRQTATDPNPKSIFPSRRFVKTGPAKNLPRLLFIGDSFSHSMTQFVPGYFRESYFVRSSHLDSTLVKAEQPDIVVFEVVERNLNYLTNL